MKLAKVILLLLGSTLSLAVLAWIVFAERGINYWLGFLVAKEDGQLVVGLSSEPTYFRIGLHWIFLLGLAIPTYSIYAWMNRERCVVLRPGICPICGYDMRATPAQCPECGYKRFIVKGTKFSEPFVDAQKAQKQD
ncbi:MAG: hypothetical protein QM770_09645 [Tepidisphaeraceae bacterium]